MTVITSMYLHVSCIISPDGSESVNANAIQIGSLIFCGMKVNTKVTHYRGVTLHCASP